MIKDNNCQFCKIIFGEDNQDFRIIFQNKKFIALLVSRPITKGHFVVFPKDHYSSISKANRAANTLFKCTLGLAKKVSNKLGTAAYTLKLNNNVYKLETNELNVGHIHIHVIPRYQAGENLDVIVKPAKSKYFKDMIKLIN